MNAVNRSVRTYQRLLWLYPKQFRDEYGDDMVFVFEEMLRDLPAPRVWGRTLRDATSSIVTQRLETLMSKQSMVRPLGFAAAAVAILIAISATGINNMAVFLFSVGVAAAACVAALIYWQANRAYVEPSDELHRYWLRPLAAGAVLIGAVNVGSGLDIEAPWLLLFSSIILGIVLVAVGAVLGVWHAVERTRSVRAA
jgi:hypothetical protein